MNLPAARSKSSENRWIAVAGAVAVGCGMLRLVRELKVETRLHAVGPDGLVDASPEGLAFAAGASLPVYALASAMQSEEHDDRGRLAVGRSIWNKVRGRADRIFRTLCPTGRFGSQTVNPYAATSRGPTSRTLELAKAIAEGRVPDFVDGAVQWDAPAAQDRHHQLYLQDPVRYRKYRWSSADVARKRTDGGAREVRVAGVPLTRFWSYT